MKDQVFVNGVDDADGLIICRNLGDNVPEDVWRAHWKWQAEYHPPSSQARGFPLAIAWICGAPPSGEQKAEGDWTWLDYLFVVDDERRKGIATMLVEACQRRWPDIRLSPAISDGGEALLRKFGQKPRLSMRRFLQGKGEEGSAKPAGKKKPKRKEG